VRKWVEGFTGKASPLVELTKKEVPFKWEEKVHRKAMNILKEAITNSSAIQLINCTSTNEVILSVNSSKIAVRYILAQEDDNRQ